MAEAIVTEAYAMLENWKRPNSPERNRMAPSVGRSDSSHRGNHVVCDALDEAWERWIREQDWESIIEIIYAHTLRSYSLKVMKMAKRQLKFL